MKTLAEKITKRSPARQRPIQAGADEPIAEKLTLRQLRESLGVSQEEMARRLETDQGNVFRFEGREDVKLSTLRGYVAALGGELHLIARFPGRPPIELTSPAPIAPRSARQ